MEAERTLLEKCPTGILATILEFCHWEVTAKRLRMINRELRVKIEQAIKVVQCLNLDSCLPWDINLPSRKSLETFMVTHQLKILHIDVFPATPEASSLLRNYLPNSHLEILTLPNFDEFPPYPKVKALNEFFESTCDCLPPTLRTLSFGYVINNNNSEKFVKSMRKLSPDRLNIDRLHLWSTVHHFPATSTTLAETLGVDWRMHHFKYENLGSKGSNLWIQTVLESNHSSLKTVSLMLPSCLGEFQVPLFRLRRPLISITISCSNDIKEKEVEAIQKLYTRGCGLKLLVPEHCDLPGIYERLAASGIEFKALEGSVNAKNPMTFSGDLVLLCHGCCGFETSSQAGIFNNRNSTNTRRAELSEICGDCLEQLLMNSDEVDLTLYDEDFIEINKKILENRSMPSLAEAFSGLGKLVARGQSEDEEITPLLTIIKTAQNLHSLSLEIQMEGELPVGSLLNSLARTHDKLQILHLHLLAISEVTLESIRLSIQQLHLKQVEVKADDWRVSASSLENFLKSLSNHKFLESITIGPFSLYHAEVFDDIRKASLFKGEHLASFSILSSSSSNFEAM